MYISFLITTDLPAVLPSDTLHFPSVIPAPAPPSPIPDDSRADVDITPLVIKLWECASSGSTLLASPECAVSLNQLLDVYLPAAASRRALNDPSLSPEIFLSDLSGPSLPSADSPLSPVQSPVSEHPAHPPPSPQPPTHSANSPPSPESTSSTPSDQPTVEYNCQSSRQTWLSKLYTYHNTNASVEYPETGVHRGVGYIFRRDPQDWVNPMLDGAYSWGRPRGQTTGRNHRYLTDLNGERVPCLEIHGTCQGCKACPYADRNITYKPHTVASRTDVLERVLESRTVNNVNAPLDVQIFKRTEAFLAAIRKAGCYSEEHEATNVPEDELEEYQAVQDNNKTTRNEYKDSVKRCGGRIKFSEDSKGKPFIYCEHYNHIIRRSHFQQYIDESLYDVEYIEARLSNDVDEIERIEAVYETKGCGPLSSCATVVNFNSRRPNCPCDHRGEDGIVIQPAVGRIRCTAKFTMYEPLEEYREQCLKVFVVYHGEHTHAVPLPTKTPQKVRDEIFELFGEMAEDMADMTARRFIRHPITRAYVARYFPDEPWATLGDIHVSLTNRDHLSMYIRQAKILMYPDGTGFSAVNAEYKRQHEADFPPEDRYIRRVVVLNPANFPIHEEDDNVDSTDGTDNLKIIICMNPEGSRRLQKSPNVQADIAYNRVVDYREFTMGSWDRNNHTSNVFVRVFLNRETAEAHKLVFEMISAIVLEDVGKPLLWRHLDADTCNDCVGILCFSGDQGGGQAKGLGLHLQAVARSRPKKDLYEDRMTSDLAPYDHLRHVFRLCGTHYKRNIRKCATTEVIRNAMRSLNCLEHDDWEGTLDIIRSGGKPARDWLANKEASGFVFAAICWKKSFIPLLVWKAGDRNDNLIETTHADANREGTRCSLLSGIEKGRRYDAVKLKSLHAIETTGIRPSYKSGHYSTNATRTYIRNYRAWAKKLHGEDHIIESYNAKFINLQDKVVKARQIRENYRAAAREIRTRPTHTQKQYGGAMEKVTGAIRKVDAAIRTWRDYVEKTRPGLPLGSGYLVSLSLEDLEDDE